MGSVVLDMSMSVDGFIAGPNDGPDNPGGDRFMRLHEWMFEPDLQTFRTSGVAARVFDEFRSSGAVLIGRNLAEQVDHWGGDHHGRGVPIFVVSHRPAPPQVAKMPLVTYVTDIAEGARRAKAAAGDKPVLMHGGGGTLKLALEAGAVDELFVHIVPVVFGEGRRLFDQMPERTELEIVRTIESPEATHIRYRVKKQPTAAA